MTQLFVFARDDLLSHAVTTGFDAVVVDLERRGKHARQDGFDTDISANTIADVGHARVATPLPIVCRIDGPGPEAEAQLEAVVAAGADEVLIPMVRRPEEVAAVIAAVDGRVGVGAMVETVDAVACADELATLGLCRVYVGLNDLWIDRRGRHRFDPFVDGTLDELARVFAAVPFGVAGLTHPDLGAPLPCAHLVNELSRLGCDYTFLRRSFFAALADDTAAAVCTAIRGALATADRRDPVTVERDRAVAHDAISSLADETAAVVV